MERDFAPRQRKRKPSVKAEAPAIAYCFWLLLGMVLGCGTTFSYLYYRESHQHKITEAIEIKTKKIEIPIHNKPQFDFYTMLPKMQVEISKQNNNRPIKEPSMTTQHEKKRAYNQHIYYLQVAAFNRVTDANTLKLKLLMKGYKAIVQTARNADQKTFHRVWVGPFEAISQAQAIKKQLAEKNYDSLLLSLSNTPTK